MSTTIIVEPNPSGHRFQAVAHVARLAAHDGDVVVLTSVGSSQRPEYDVHLAGLALSIEESVDSPQPTTRALVRAVGAASRRHGADRIVVMDGDRALKQWWLLAPRELRSLPRRPHVAYFLTNYPARLQAADWPQWRRKLAKAALVLLARSTRSLDHASGFAGRDEEPGGWVVKRALDPALCTAHARDRDELRAEHALPAGRTLVGIFGGINVRKNPQLVLDAVLRAGDHVDLVLAGPFDAVLRAWLEALPDDRRSRVHAVDGFLAEDVLDQHLAAVDVVALVMTLEGPSGIQGKALAAGVPVVSAGSRTRARELTATDSGVDVAPTVEGVVGGIHQVLARYGGVPLSRTHLATAEQFAAIILGVVVSERQA